MDSRRDALQLEAALLVGGGVEHGAFDPDRRAGNPRPGAVGHGPGDRPGLGRGGPRGGQGQERRQGGEREHRGRFHRSPPRTANDLTWMGRG